MSNSLQYLSAAHAHLKDSFQMQLPSYVPSLDGTADNHVATLQPLCSSSVYNMGATSVPGSQPDNAKPNLSLLTDIGRKYPGFPTPLSPTPSAKDLFPSPESEHGSGIISHKPLSPAVRSVSPMSVDGSEMCGPSRRCQSHGYEHYRASLGLIDNILTASNAHNDAIWRPRSPSRISSRSTTPLVSPRSPPCTTSPRIAMLKSLIGKQVQRDLPSNIATQFPILELHPKACVPASARSTTVSVSPRSSVDPVCLSIEIANGTETSTVSPISPTGTVLSYTSHRPVESGLIGVRPLSEAQVAEYRFWRPCSRRVCALGCGGAREGELAAAKRLFRGVEEVKPEVRSYRDGFYDQEGFTYSTPNNKSPIEVPQPSSSLWAGRRLVANWNQFLRECEREGVAKF